MTAAVASVPTLGLPYAVALLGWPGGMISLIAGGLVTMFTCILIAGLLDFGGRRHLRYRNLAQAVIGVLLSHVNLQACAHVCKYHVLTLEPRLCQYAVSSWGC